VSDKIDVSDNPTAVEALRPVAPETYAPGHLTGTAITEVSGSYGGGVEYSSCSCNIPDLGAHRASYQPVGDSRSWLSAATNFDSNPLAAELCCSSRHTLHPESLAAGDHNAPVDGYIPQSLIQDSGHATENESTMPCAEAYLLIEQQNFKGVHQKDVAT
jgi:hypothetical protein